MIQNNENELKTSTAQRVWIGIIAAVLLITTIMIYVSMMVDNTSGTSSSLTAAEELEYTALLDEYQTKVSAQNTQLSGVYFNTFKEYKSYVKAYNAASVIELTTKDLKVGTGATINDDNLDYYAYYIGWCGDETVFDSSLNDFDNPTALLGPVRGGGSGSLIEGWVEGVDGMKIGGVRQVLIPGELAYGSDREVCGSYNTPLQFIIMAIESPEEITAPDRLNDLHYKKYYTQ